MLIIIIHDGWEGQLRYFWLTFRFFLKPFLLASFHEDDIMWRSHDGWLSTKRFQTDPPQHHRTAPQCRAGLAPAQPKGRRSSLTEFQTKHIIKVKGRSDLFCLLWFAFETPNRTNKIFFFLKRFTKSDTVTQNLTPLGGEHGRIWLYGAASNCYIICRKVINNPTIILKQR
jgi:hypothetical protein